MTLDHYLHENFDTVISHVSVYSGYLSFTIWLFAQLPQIIENYFNRSVEGVNILFLGCWISGDLTNLMGCLLTKALPFQTLLASYYCFIDMILCFQFWYYIKVYPYHTTPHNLLQSPNMVRYSSPGQQVSPKFLKHPRPNGFMGNFLTVGLISANIKKAKAMFITQPPPSHLWPSFNDIGKILAWICSCFYISSRIPQVITNFQKKSTTGISPYLFLFAMLGNTLYTISISLDLYLLYYRKSPNWWKAFSDQLPFLLGSSGTILFDTVILGQCWYYRHNDHYTTQPFETFNNSMDFNRGPFQQSDWNFIYEDDNEEFANHSNIISSIPHHYVSASSPSNGSYSKITKSVKIRSSSISSNSHRSPSLTTALIPSIINSYSSVLKKMSGDQKIPFLPSDFLSDDFHRHVENSLFH